MQDLEAGRRLAQHAAGHAVAHVFRVQQFVEPDQLAVVGHVDVAPRGVEGPGRFLALEILAAPGAEGLALPQLAAVGADVDTVGRHLVEVDHARMGGIVVPAVDEGVHLFDQGRVGVGSVRDAGQEQADARSRCLIIASALVEKAILYICQVTVVQIAASQPTCGRVVQYRFVKQTQMDEP
jgi:hypothetical protein